MDSVLTKIKINFQTNSNKTNNKTNHHLIYFQAQFQDN